MENFNELLTEPDFQAGDRSDELHKIFLHQAVLNALLVGEVGEKRICLLPADDSYPYNLQDQVPESRRAATFNELIYVLYEGCTRNPGNMDDIKTEEPLRLWLVNHWDLNLLVSLIR